LAHLALFYGMVLFIVGGDYLSIYLFNLNINTDSSPTNYIIIKSRTINLQNNLVNRVKTNNSDDKVFASTSWYNIIANAADRNTLPTEQTSVHLGTHRDPPRHKNRTNDNIY
jgi:hypothetical protein